MPAIVTVTATYKNIQPPAVSVGVEDAFCRRAYAIMMRGARFMKDRYHEWPTQPNCGYLGWGAHGEKDINTNLTRGVLSTSGRAQNNFLSVSPPPYET